MKIVFRCLPELEGIIPRPYPAKKGLPEWLKKMPMTAFSEDWEKEMPTVKQCPPFVDVMSYGFLIPLPCDIRVEEGRFEWDWDAMPLTVSDRHTPRSPLGVHPMEQATGTPIYDEDSIVIKFMTQWVIELEPGYSLLATHPFNRPDLPFLTLTGLVDSDLYANNYLNYPAVWTDKDFSGVLAKGTPIAQCIPIERARFDFEFGSLEGEAMDRFLGTQRDLKDMDSPYKKKWRAKKG